MYDETGDEKWKKKSVSAKSCTCRTAQSRREIKSSHPLSGRISSDENAKSPYQAFTPRGDEGLVEAGDTNPGFPTRYRLIAEIGVW
jgi:hypothetical protein